MGKLFCIMGKSASGKDTIYRRLTQDAALSLRMVIPYTTRPIRNGEENGRDYYFVTDSDYEKMCENKQIIESRTYQTVNGPWHYFTADDGQIDLEKGNFIIIGTLEAYLQIRQYFGKDKVVPVYIEVPDDVRLERALMREKIQKIPNYAELCRRYLADCEDFSEEKLKEAGISRKYQNIDADICYQQISQDIRK